jgi:hypothetical protein
MRCFNTRMLKQVVYTEPQDFNILISRFKRIFYGKTVLHHPRIKSKEKNNKRLKWNPMWMYFSATHATRITLKAGLVAGILHCIYCISSMVSGISSEQWSSQPLVRAFKLQSSIIAHNRMRSIQLRYPGTICPVYWFWFHGSAFLNVQGNVSTVCELIL